ncbi:hypothetical protein BCR43DRAFT_483104 [Syncephalastrum racemosum]|uniref:Uncharacterized protein n=1 Tax=Syncephalastrum racemosum TaxID=13706 RepID=A0A1X2HUN2_SYNRA|nr:hypothetical protein BCR43DRAFT_483104 [Syncephalastrum racemosum]
MTTLSDRITEVGPRYRELAQILALEHNASLQFESCTVDRDRLAQQIQSKQAELNNLTESSKREFQKVRKLKHLSLQNAAATLTGKKREMVLRGQENYQHAFDIEQSCKRDIEQLSAELGVLAQTQNQAEQELSRSRHAKAELSQLLEEVFTVSDPAYPYEPQLKAELQNYLSQQEAATRDLGRFKDADHNLVEARRELMKGTRMVDAAISYVPFDLFGGTIMDVQQLTLIEGVRRHTQEAQRRLNTARRVLPELPHPATLDVVTNNILLQMRLDINYVDIAWKAKAQHAGALFGTVQHNIDSSLRWVRQYIQYTEGALERLKIAVDSVRASLETERRRIVEGILSGEPVDGRADDVFDQPPPMYEAPPEDEEAPTADVPAVPSPLQPTSRQSIPSSPLSSDMMTQQSEPSYVSHNINNPFASH